MSLIGKRPCLILKLYKMDTILMMVPRQKPVKMWWITRTVMSSSECFFFLVCVSRYRVPFFLSQVNLRVCIVASHRS